MNLDCYMRASSELVVYEVETLACLSQYMYMLFI